MVSSDNPDSTEQFDRIMIDAVTKIFQKTYRQRREAASAAIGSTKVVDGQPEE